MAEAQKSIIVEKDAKIVSKTSTIAHLTEQLQNAAVQLSTHDHLQEELKKYQGLKKQYLELVEENDDVTNRLNSKSREVYTRIRTHACMCTPTSVITKLAK